ncbi:c-type cytochrome [Sphingorhabdus sp. M41]|uniref:c-type cytochrome n=1 Tax=Sphingorhabdus sp. M41 TaxID=1806885 RepID=UPI001E3FF39A|nr:c-type cytochrome [Sphingorhabdus sp. M41]
MKSVAAIVTLAVLTAGCSSGGSEPSKPASGTAEATDPAATAPPADSGPPAVDDIATLDGPSYASLTGDAASGKAAFMQCRTCHVVDPGMNRVGPSLANIIGREAGSVAGFRYSEASANSDIIWTEEKLFQFLEKPQRVIPKTKMIFAGMPDAQKRADVIAYLKNPS